MDPDKSSEINPDNFAQCTARWGLLAFGWVNVGLGMIGVVVPGMPTTVFLIIAVWAFSKSSVRFQRWLWEHQTFGPSIRAWHEHRVIPKKAKIMASLMMAASFIYVTFFVAESWVLPAVLAAVLVPSAAFILSQASTTPNPSPVAETSEPS
jgi:hypothetical protein